MELKLERLPDIANKIVSPDVVATSSNNNLLIFDLKI